MQYVINVSLVNCLQTFERKQHKVKRLKSSKEAQFRNVSSFQSHIKSSGTVSTKLRMQQRITSSRSSLDRPCHFFSYGGEHRFLAGNGAIEDDLLHCLFNGRAFRHCSGIHLTQTSTEHRQRRPKNLGINATANGRENGQEGSNHSDHHVDKYL